MRDTERDNFMSAPQAQEYGLVDAVLYDRDARLYILIVKQLVNLEVAHI